MRPIADFTDDRLTQLREFLAQHQLKNIVQIHGFLTAVISSPGLMPPSQWINHLGFNNKSSSAEEFQRLFGIVMSFYNDICTKLSENTFSIERFFETAGISENLLAEKRVWAHAYTSAAQLDPLWNANEISEPFSQITVLALDDKQIEIVAKGDPARVKEILTGAGEYLSDFVIEINEHWRKKRVEMMHQMREPKKQKTASQGPKVGRNDPCPCGSGKKFKKCCLN